MITISIIANLSGGTVTLRHEGDRITIGVTAFQTGKVSQAFGMVERTAKGWRFAPDSWECPEITCRTAREVGALVWAEWQKANPDWRSHFEAPNGLSSSNQKSLFEKTSQALDQAKS